MGHGAEWLFCFHGYGESARSFELLEPLLGGRFTIIAIDMPFHGNTAWNDGLLFEPRELVELIHAIKPKPIPMHVLGFSMGGRVALQLLHDIPQEIARLVLVAPDGLHRNKWQWLATQTKTGNRLFRMAMQRPAVVKLVMAVARKVGAYPKRVQKFVSFYLDGDEQRNILYKRWSAMREFGPRKHLLRSVVLQHGIPVRMLFGKYDAVILARHGHAFARDSNGLVKVHEIDAGHQLLKTKYLPEILALINA